MGREGWLALGLAAALLVGVAVWTYRRELGHVAEDAAHAAGDAVDALKAATTSAQWAVAFWAAIGDALPSLSTPARLIVLAHAAYESGWGKAKAAQRGNNFFNITAGPSWTGERWTDVGGDLEYAKDGTKKRIDQVWRAYPTVRAGLLDYWQFLGPTQNRGRYVAARARLEAGDVQGFSQALYAAGYYTLPPEQYGAQLAAVVRTARGFVGVA